MQIAVIGTGYVGLVAGTCFADLGWKVNCLDTDNDKIEALKKGIIPIYEPGLEELVEKNINNFHLSFSTDIKTLDASDILVIAVGTPQTEDGSADLRYFNSVIDEIIQYSTRDKFIIIKSTVPIGTALNTAEIFTNKRSDIKFHIISNPEFLREGCAVKDFMEPDRIIIGTNLDPQAIAIGKKLYGPLALKDYPIFCTDNTTAELIKYASNAFLATKVAYINEIANLSAKCGANIEDVSKAMGYDPRIGKLFLHPGPGYGGSCFPKDTLAIAKTCRDFAEDSLIINAVIESNNNRKRNLIDKVKVALGDDLNKKKVAILGLAFKAETNDMRDSPSIDLINSLLKCGTQINSYDPKASKEAYQIFADKILYAKSVNECVKDVDCIIIITEWSEFKLLDFKELESLVRQKIIIDYRNIYSLEEMRNSNFKYISVGREIING